MMTRESLERLCEQIYALAEPYSKHLHHSMQFFLAHDQAQRAVIEQQEKEMEYHKQGCLRSHPHEEMNEVCELKTEIARLKNELSHWSWVRFKQLEEENQALREALRELYAVVQGECPRLLNEDSGGDAELCMKIEQALKEEK